MGDRQECTTWLPMFPLLSSHNKETIESLVAHFWQSPAHTSAYWCGRSIPTVLPDVRMVRALSCSVDPEPAAAVQTADAEVQTDPLQHPRYQPSPDMTALDSSVLQSTAAAVKAANRKLLDPVGMTEQAAAVLSGLEQWLPAELLAAAEAAITAGHAARQQLSNATNAAAAAAADDQQF